MTLTLMNYYSAPRETEKEWRVSGWASERVSYAYKYTHYAYAPWAQAKVKLRPPVSNVCLPACPVCLTAIIHHAAQQQQQQCGHAALLLWLFWLTIFRSFYPTHTLTRLDIDIVFIYTLVVPTSLMLCVYLTHSFYLFRVYPFSFSFVQLLLKLNAIISCQIPHRAAGNPSMRIRTSTLSWAWQSRRTFP